MKTIFITLTLMLGGAATQAQTVDRFSIASLQTSTTGPVSPLYGQHVIVSSAVAAQTQILARHQESLAVSPLYRPQASPLQLNSGAGKSKKRTGIIMMGAGAALFTTGCFIFRDGREEARAWHHDHPGEKTFGLWDNDSEAAGAVLIGVGAGATVSGIVLWAQGARQQHRMKLEEQGFHTPIPGARRTSNGIVMVTMGVAAQIGGIILIHKQREETNTSGNLKGAGGTFFLLAGTGLAAAGTFMWWTGSIRVNNAKLAHRQTLSFNLGPTPSLCYKF